MIPLAKTQTVNIGGKTIHGSASYIAKQTSQPKIITKNWYGGFGGGRIETKTTLTKTEISADGTRKVSTQKVTLGKPARQAKKVVRTVKGRIESIKTAVAPKATEYIPDSSKMYPKKTVSQQIKSGSFREPLPKGLTSEQAIIEKAGRLEKAKATAKGNIKVIEQTNKQIDEYNKWLATSKPKTPTLDKYTKKTEQIEKIEKELAPLESTPNLAGSTKEMFQKKYAEKLRLEEEARALYPSAKKEYESAKSFYSTAQRKAEKIQTKMEDVKSKQAFVEDYFAGVKGFTSMMENYKPSGIDIKKEYTKNVWGAELLPSRSLKKESELLVSKKQSLEGLKRFIKDDGEVDLFSSDIKAIAKYNIGSSYIAGKAEKIEKAFPESTKYIGDLHEMAEYAASGYVWGGGIGGTVGTAFAPGPGTIVGATTGAVGGAVGAGFGYMTSSAFGIAGKHLDKWFKSDKTKPYTFKSGKDPFGAFKYSKPYTADIWEKEVEMKQDREKALDIIFVGSAIATGSAASKTTAQFASSGAEFLRGLKGIKEAQISQKGFVSHDFEMDISPSKGKIYSFQKISSGGKKGFAGIKGITKTQETTWETFDPIAYRQQQKLIERMIENRGGTTSMAAQWNLSDDLMKYKAQLAYQAGTDPLDEFLGVKQAFSFPEKYQMMAGKTYTVQQQNIARFSYENPHWARGQYGYEPKTWVAKKLGFFEPKVAEAKFASTTTMGMKQPYQSYFATDAAVKGKHAKFESFGNQVVFTETGISKYGKTPFDILDTYVGKGTEVKDFWVATGDDFIKGTGTVSGKGSLKSALGGRYDVSTEMKAYLSGSPAKSTKLYGKNLYVASTKKKSLSSLFADQKGYLNPGRTYEELLKVTKTKMPVGLFDIQSPLKEVSYSKYFLTSSLPLAKIAGASALLTWGQQKVSLGDLSAIKPKAMIGLKTKEVAELQQLKEMVSPKQMQFVKPSTVQIQKVAELTEPKEVVVQELVTPQSISFASPFVPPVIMTPALFGSPYIPYEGVGWGYPGKKPRKGKKGKKVRVRVKSDPARKAILGERDVWVTRETYDLYRKGIAALGPLFRMPTKEQFSKQGGLGMARKRTTRKRKTTKRKRKTTKRRKRR